MRSPRLLPAAFLALVLAFAAVAAPAASADTFVVDSAGDEPDPDLTDDFCAIGDEPTAPCTLRAAIQNVNHAAGPHTIAFDLPPDELTIRPETALPAISETVTIDGRTQDGWEERPLVVLDGSELPPVQIPPPDPNGGGQEVPGPYLLQLAGVNSHVDALTLTEHETALLAFTGAHGSSVARSFVGTTPSGNQAATARALVGVWVQSAAQVQVGGGVGERNILAGSETNVMVTGRNSVDDMIFGNSIGFGYGEDLVGDADFGVLVSEDMALGMPSGTRVIGNVVGGGQIGIRISEAPGVSVVGNWVGFDESGNASDLHRLPLAPADTGIDVVDAKDTVVGGTTAGAFNAIAGLHHGTAVQVRGSATGVRVEGNRIGTDIAGMTITDTNFGDTRNEWGIVVGPRGDRAPANVTIGGTDRAQGNLVSNNGDEHSAQGGGIGIHGEVQDVRVLNNAVGGRLDGSGGLPNRNAGIAVDGSNGVPTGVRIGAAGDGNAVSDVTDGWGIINAEAPSTLIQGNRVGIDFDGGPGSVAGGIAVAADGAVVGGRNDGEGNVVAAVLHDGIVVAGGVDGAKLIGNWVGTDADGHTPSDLEEEHPYAIGRYGIAVRQDQHESPTFTRIGGSLPGEANVIGRAGEAGIATLDEAKATRIEGNLVGVRPAGDEIAASHGDGILIESGDAIVGGAFGDDTANYVAGTRGPAIHVSEGDGVLVQGNVLGREIGGDAGLQLFGPGIRVDRGAQDVWVGYGPDEEEIPVGECSGACNHIGFALGAAVSIAGDDTQRVTVRGNEPFNNEGQNIDLDNLGHLDEDDLDEGANTWLNPPTAVRATIDPETGKDVVTGVVEAMVPEALRVDVYAHPYAADAERVDDGLYVGTAVPDERGVFRLEVAEEAVSYTAVALDSEGNVSDQSDGCRDVLGIGETDRDGDGLCDEWEQEGGLDFNGDEVIDEQIYNADPAVRDLYVELDYMDRSFWELGNLSPSLDVLHRVSMVFGTAPEPITLHWGDSEFPEASAWVPGEEVPHAERLRVGSTGPDGPDEPDDLDDLRYGDDGAGCTGWFGTEEQREDEDCWMQLGARGVLYRYGVMADRLHGQLAATQSGEAFAVGLGDRTDEQIANLAGGRGVCYDDEYCRALVEASAVTHELGHTLGLDHHGHDAENEKVAPNYLSVMNPMFALPGLIPNQVLDFSRSEAPLSESALNESSGLPGRTVLWTETVVFAYDEELDNCVARRVPLERRVDLDRDGNDDEQGIAVSLNEPDIISDEEGLEECQKAGSASDTIEGFNDYEHMRFDPATVPTYPDGAVELGGLDLLAHIAAADGDEDGVRDAEDVCTAVADPEQEDADGDGIGDACLALVEERDLSVDVAVTESAEGVATATVTLRNAFPLAATGARVAITLPGDWQALGAEASAGTYDAGTGTWTVPEVAKRGAVTLTLTGRSEAEGARVLAELAAADQPDWDSTPGGGDLREDDRDERPLALPRVDVADASVTEGTRRARKLAFPVRLTRAAPVEVRVRATTADATATAADYTQTGKVVVFAPGETEAAVEVPVRPDRDPEADETLTLTLADADGASMGDAEAVGTIEDDDEPAATGDLLPLTCISAKLDDGPCGIEDPSLYDIRDVEVAGDRDVYVAGEAHIALYQRDAATERLRRASCWAIASHGNERGCARLPKPADPDETLAKARTRHMTASADDRTIAMTFDHQASGENDSFAVFRREADGRLRMTGCIGHQIPGNACMDEPVTRGEDLLVAPDGRFAYIVTGTDVTRVDLDAEGAPTAVDRWTVPGAPEEQDVASRAALSPDGTLLVTRADDVLYALTRDATTGALALRGSVALAGDGPVTFSRDGATIFAASGGEDATVRSLRAADLAPVACASRTEQAGCAAAPALRWPGGLAVGADGRDVYVALGGGGVLGLRRAADGALTAGRCVDPETGAATCGTDDGEQPRRAVVHLTEDGRAAFAADGSYAYQLLRRDGDPAQNRAPICADATSFGQPGEAQTLRLECVDPDGDALTLEPGAVAHGTLDAVDQGRGTVTYTPAAGYRGPDELVFRARDARNAVSADARVAITVANEAPVCRDQGALIVTNRRGPIVAPCSDADGDPLTVEVVQPPAHGTLGAFDRIVGHYDPAPGYRGQDELKLRVSDGHDVSAVATVAITIDDRAPVCATAGDQLLQVGRKVTVKLDCADPEGTPVKLAVKTVSAGRATLDGNELTYRAGSRGGVATVTIGLTDGDGRTSDVALRFHVSEPRPSCRNNCQPDDDGDVTVEYRCNGSSTDVGGYASCQGHAVIVVCSKTGCRTARGTVVAGAAAAKKAKILPGVKGKRLGTARSKVKPGRTGKLEIRLSKQGRKLLARKKKVKVKIVVEIRQLDGTRSRTTRVVTLRAPKKKRTTTTQ